MATWTGAAGTSDWYYIKHTHLGYSDDVVTSNWDVSPNIPGQGDSISIGSVYTVTNGSGTYGSLTLGTGASLTTNNLLSVSSVANGGSIGVGGGTTAYFVIRSSAATLTGGGTITLMSNDPQHYGTVIGHDDGASLVLTNADNTINGGGSIGGYRSGTLTLINDGIINATGNSSNIYGALNIDAAGGVTNNALIEATGSAGLTTASNIDNRNGRMVVLDGSRADLSGVITGGVVSATGSGQINANGATFDGSNTGGIALSGTVNSSGATLNGAVFNGGTINVGTFSSLYTGSAGATLNGGGNIVLHANASQQYPSVIYGAQNANVILTNIDNTISGGGSISDYRGNALTFINWGTVNATGDSSNGYGALTIDATGGLTNAGTMEAGVLGSTMNISTGRVVTNNGLFDASNGGTLNVSDAVVGSGSGLIAKNGTMAFSQSYGQNVRFQGANAGLLVAQAGYSGTVFGFATGDEIDLGNVSYSSGDHVTMAGNSLDILDANNAFLGSVALDRGGRAGDFQLSSYSGGGTLITRIHDSPPTSVTRDFNGDGTSDILLQNGGTVADWTMQGGQFASGSTLTTAATGYRVAGSGDFNGDETSDIVLQNGGIVVDWIMHNGVVQSGSVLTTAATGYSVVGTGDFNGDGLSDILLQNGGTVVDWIMQNGVVQSGHVLTTAATGYTVVGTGDFNGDGTTDILLQNGGTVVDWIMQNGVVQSGNVLTTAASGYTVVGTGDFNGDGTTDIALQSGGIVVDWLMSAGAVQGGNVITTGATGYNVVGTGDYNGDGTSDMVLQNNSGTVVDWLMHNGAFASGNVVTTGLPAGWGVV